MSLLSLSIGISKIHSCASELSTAYNEALEALSYNFYGDKNISIYSTKSFVQYESSPIQIHTNLDKILSNIQQGSDNCAIIELRSLFGKFRQNREPVEQIKATCIMLCSFCFRLLANCSISLADNFLDEGSIFKQIQESRTIKKLFLILASLIKSSCSIISSNFQQNNFIVNEVDNYIYNNYNKYISLKIIAKHVHLNSCYLSRLYKKETGISIIDKLNSYRIEVSKKLLKDTSKKVSDVAAEVGIADQAYFTRVFIKYTGISPREFRSKLNKSI